MRPIQLVASMFVCVVLIVPSDVTAEGPIVIIVPVPESSEHRRVDYSDAGRSAGFHRTGLSWCLHDRGSGPTTGLCDFAAKRGFKISKNGDMPIRVLPLLNGGFKVDSLEIFAIYVKPDAGGGYRIQEVGGKPTYLRPTWDGGFKIIPPGGLTRYVAPDWGVIDPDQAPVPVPVIFDRD